MSQVKENTDNELMLQIVGYNAEAFKQLFNRYSPSLLALIKEVISNPKLAESVLVNVFSVFLKRLDYFSTNSNNVFTYLTLLTRNISIDVLKRMKFVEDIPIYSNEYEIEFILPSLSKEIVTIDLDKRYMLGEQFKNYRSQLTEVQNLLLSLIYFEGLNEEEIAKRLNVPMVTVRQKVLGIMENLHLQYAGQNSVNHENKAILELIKLEALGFLTSEERMMLANLKENDPDFLWKELGEYQNVTALISTSIPEQALPKNYDEEMMNIFTQILLQDGDVQYPIVASEIPLPEPEILKPIEQSKPVKAVIDNPVNVVSVKQEEPVKVEQKETGFHLKFREPDPAELNILRKLDKTETKQKAEPVVNRIDKETLQKEVKPQVSKPDVVISRIANAPRPKDIVNQTLKINEQVQDKINIEPVLPVKDIINDDPSIIIDEPNEIKAKVDQKPVSRLTPTSSIKIEDIIKKDVNIHTRKNTLVENSKLNNPLLFNKAGIDVKKEEIKPSRVEQEPKPIVENKEEIKFKVNEPPKEVKPSVVETEKQQTIVEVKKAETEKFEIKFKTSAAPKEIKPNSSVQIKPQPEVTKKQEEVVDAKNDEKNEIKFRAPEPPKEIRKAIQPPFIAKKTEEIKPNNSVQINPQPEVAKKQEEVVDAKNDEKNEIKFSTPEPPKEIKKSIQAPVISKKVEEIKPVVVKQEKPAEHKPIEQIKNLEKPVVNAAKTEQELEPVKNINAEAADTNIKDLKAEDAKKISSLFKTRERKVEGTIKSIDKPSSEKTPLKIRETNFNEDSAKKENTAKTDLKVDEIKSVVENILRDKNLNGTVSVEEVLSKLTAEKAAEKDEQNEQENNPESKVIFKDFSYDEEMAKINKQSRKKVIVYAAVFVLLAVAGIFAYLNMKPETVKAASNVNIKKVNQPVVNEQPSDLIASNQVLETSTENLNKEAVVEEKEIKPEDKTTKDVQVKLPPLPESLEKKESTYFALNEKNDLMTNQQKINNQTAAAKTETTTPPKENKVKEEEPAFFVAVEEMPELVGGLKNLQTKIKYPEIAKRQGLEGKVLVQAIVDENGKVISANTIKGIGGGCDEVAINAVKNSTFIPGKQRGKNVKVQVTIPIVFKK